MRKGLLTGFVIAMASLASGASAQTVVSADVGTNTTWSGTVVLQKPIFVQSGAILTILPGTIVRGQPRTSAVVPGSVVGTPGALVVTQDGRLNAQGSASNPIIFTTAATDNDNNGVADASGSFFAPWDPGDTFLDDDPVNAPVAPLNKLGTNDNTALWGGVVILGRAPTNLSNKCGSVGWGQCTIEGLTVPGFPAAKAAYGGNLPHDNSGILTFASIRHAGDEIGASNELNGLSMGGVGDNTVIQNVEVYANFDDGFEWFGGTVNGKNLMVSFVGDDMFDADEGYTGVNQFLFGIAPFFNETDAGAFGSASGDKACEFDGENHRPDNVTHQDNLNVRLSVEQMYTREDPNDPGDPLEGTLNDPNNYAGLTLAQAVALFGDMNIQPWPMSNPQFYNMTIIGTTVDLPREVNPTSVAADNLGCEMRNGFAGDVFNSIIVNTGTQKGLSVSTTESSSPPGFSTLDNANNDLINVTCSTFDDVAAMAAAENTVLANGNALNLVLGGTSPAGDNVVNNAAFPGLLKEDQTFDATGNAAGKLVSTLKPGGPINPRPGAGITGIGGCVSPTKVPLGLDPAATYRGAFLRTATTLWTTGWTALNKAGLLAN
jgi:hypothetical protein